MNQNSLHELFPRHEDILVQYPHAAPLHQFGDLIAGRLQPWDRPT